MMSISRRGGHNLILRMVCVLAGFPAFIFAQTPTPAVKLRTFSAGGDGILWIAASQQTTREPTDQTWLSYIDRTSSQIRSLSGPLAETETILRIAVAGSDLHVFYKNGTHYRYGRHSSRREVRLPEQVIPEAMAGDAGEPTSPVFAVVSGATFDAVTVGWQQTQRIFSASQPMMDPIPASQPATRPVLRDRPAGGYYLVKYSGADWAPESPMPFLPANVERMWLACGDQRLHLFWQQTRQDHDVSYAWYENGAWTPGERLHFPMVPADLAAGVGNHQLVVIAMLPDRDPGMWQPYCRMRAARSAAKDTSPWTEVAALTGVDGKRLSLPAGSTAAPFGDQLAIVTPAIDEPRVAFWGVTGGKPDQPFRPIPLRKSLTDSEQHSHRDLRTALALAALLVVVFWRRQTTFAAPVSLPPGLLLAGAARRAVGALIDLLPALIVVLVIWHTPLKEAMDGLSQSGANDQAQVEAFAVAAYVPSLVLRFIYIAYCTVFELIWSRTPGKWIAGCTVISENLSPPNWIQIVVRNITRFVELEPFLPISLPLLLLVLLTRNRQRVGDLLAHTLVIEPGITLDPGVDEREP